MKGSSLRVANPPNEVTTVVANLSKRDEKLNKFCRSHFLHD